MTWIKICGITNLEDAQTAVEAGADALGFVFYEESPRHVSPETVGEIVAKLPAPIEKVGVFAAKPMREVISIVQTLALSAMQIQFIPGVEPVSSTVAFGMGAAPQFKCYLSFPAQWFIEDQPGAEGFISTMVQTMRHGPPGEEPTGFSSFFRTIFLDSATSQQPGGTGKVFDWEKAAPIVEHMRPSVNVVVAGGLTPSNVGEAIHVLKPWGVDVSSGVEASPGRKDPEKVRAFIAAVRAAELRDQ